MRMYGIILLLLFFPVVAASSPNIYHSYNECSFYTGACSLDVDMVSKTITVDMKLSLPNDYGSLKILSAELDRSNPSLCKQVLFGSSEATLGTGQIIIEPDSDLVVKGVDCTIPVDNWLRTDFRVQYERVDVENGYSRSFDGRLTKFMMSPDYEDRERLKKNFYRYIPLVVIAGLSALGMVRVKR